MFFIHIKKFLKKLYDLIPFKKQVFLVLRMLHPNEAIYKHLHLKGPFRIKLDQNRSFRMIAHGNIEENELFWRGIDNGWEKTSLQIWKTLCKDADVILDIGANTGLYALVAAALHPEARILAFEPLPKVVNFLRQNIELNEFQIDVIPKAASSFSGKATVYLPMGDDFAYSVTVNKSLLSADRPQYPLEIETITLKDIILQYDLSKIDLMKIDVETHEPEVLEGMGEFLELFMPDMIIEVWDPECALRLNTLLKGIPYLYFDIDDQKGTITQKEKIEVSSFWNYLICKKETAQKLKLIE